MTEFMPSHPGGVGMLKMVAGHDATQHFEEMHKPEILTSIGSLYRIGRLEVAATTAAEAAVAPQAGNSNAHGGDSGSSGSATAAAPKPEADDAVYTMAEVEQHSSKTDCWIVIGNFPVVGAHPATLSVPWIHSLSATITAHCVPKFSSPNPPACGPLGLLCFCRTADTGGVKSVYDVSTFMTQHPGGSSMLEMVAGATLPPAIITMQKMNNGNFRPCV